MPLLDVLADEMRRMFADALTNVDPRSPVRATRAFVEVDGFALGLPIERGGMGLGLRPAVEMGVAAGRTLAPFGAFEATAAALDGLSQSGPPPADAYFDALCSGAATCVAAGGHATDPDADAAVRLVVDGSGVWFLEDRQGVRLVLDLPDGWSSWRRLRHAAYLVGVADTGYEMALRHARERKVGGQPLVARQLVVGRLVRLLTDVRLAWAACEDAVGWYDAGRVEPAPADRAHRLARRAALRGSRDFVQLLGARGLTELSAGPALYRLVNRELRRLDQVRA
jgi:alkylation response protein AidB-like acyl-CoA dehydrogenase